MLIDVYCCYLLLIYTYLEPALQIKATKIKLLDVFTD